jgi:cobalt-zinc-cadmium efflux system protein
MVTLLIVAVITTGTWSLLRDSLDLALDAVPKEIDPGEVNAYLLGLPGTQSVHDLHIWAMSTTEIALTVHLVMPLEHYVTEGEFLDTASKGLRERFGIAHATLQIEPGAQNGSCSDMHV